MTNLISSFSDLLGTFSEHRYLDDGIDRANRIYAPVLLMVSASLLGLIQFFGDPIECTKTDQDASADMDYVKTYCWAHGTYDIETDRRLSYYQWVPVVLAIQAFFFQVPFLFWAQRSRASGLNLPTLMKGAFALTEVQKDKKTREETVAEIANLMHSYFRRNLVASPSVRRRTLSNLTMSYFLSKILYLLNIAMQMFFLNQFLDDLFLENFNSVVKRNLLRSDGAPSKLFPLLARCKFYNNFDDLKETGGGPKAHLCTLPLNLYNDRLFAYICLLLLLMMVGMVFSIGEWAVKLLVPSSKDIIVKKVLQENRLLISHPSDVERFVNVYLRTDGVLVLKLVRLNMGVHVSREIVTALFPLFAGNESHASNHDGASSPSVASSPRGPSSPRSFDLSEDTRPLREKSPLREESPV